jgi:hypothetical protein
MKPNDPNQCVSWVSLSLYPTYSLESIGVEITIADLYRQVQFEADDLV